MLPGNGRRSHLKWLVPGMHVKRWLLLLILGSIVLSLGFAVLLRSVSNNELLSPVLYLGLLQFLDRPWRAPGFLRPGAWAYRAGPLPAGPGPGGTVPAARSEQRG